MRSPHLVLPLTYCEVVAVVARQPHKLEVGGSIPPHATKDFNILLLFLSVYKDSQSEILDGRVVAKL